MSYARGVPVPPSYEPLLTRLDAASKVLITTHVRPDGDALGTSAALALALQSKGKQVQILLLSKLPSKYRWVLEDPQLSHIDASATPLPDFAAFDTVLVVDTGTWSQLPGLQQPLSHFQGRVLILDHHKTQEPWGNERLVDITSSSAAELAWQVIKAWGVPLTPGTPLARHIAEAVFVGVVSDTGWYRFSNATPATLRLAADLMEAGVDTDRMYQRLFQSEREPRVRLQTRALASMEIRAGGRLAVMKIRKRDFDETHAAVPDTENVINLPLEIGAVEMSLLAVEPPEGGAIRLSCRSKGRVDVARFAEQFGGGGHARASGLKVEGLLDDVVAKVATAAERAIDGNAVSS